MDVIFERAGALDVRKAQVTARVRVPGEDGREQRVAEFKSTVQGLLALPGHTVTLQEAAAT